MTSARLVTVTLARAWDPGEAEEDGLLIEFSIALDAQGHADVQAWLDDPAVWPARRLRDGRPPRPGDVAHDEEGWQLRFFGSDGPDPDAPTHRMGHIEGGLRPGVVLTLHAPNGAQKAWRVVAVSAPDP